MGLYYPSGCDPVLQDHFCDECGQLELGRVRSVAFIKNSFTFVNPSSAAEWQAGIASKDIIIIPQTNGSFDGGAPKEGASFGDQVFRTISYIYTLQFRDPNWKENRAFWNSITYSRSYSVAIRTETQILLSNSPVNFEVKTPVADDITSEVVWDITCKWQSQALPTIFDAPATIFDRCFAIN